MILCPHLWMNFDLGISASAIRCLLWTLPDKEGEQGWRKLSNKFDKLLAMGITKSSFIFRLLVGIAWALTVVLASPQAIIWRVLKHPDIQPDFYQVSRDAKSDELGEPVHAIFQFILFPPQSVLILKKAILALVLAFPRIQGNFMLIICIFVMIRTLFACL